MRKSIFFIFFILNSMLFNILQAESNLNYQTSTRIYLGVNAANLCIEDSLMSIHIKGSDDVYGGNLGFEYFTPDAFYFAAKCDMLWGGSEAYSVSYKKFHFVNLTDPKFCHANIEFGYAKPYGNMLFTPYAGIGYWLLKSDDDDIHFKSAISFSAYGVRTDYYVSPVCSIGVNIKIFRSFHTNKHFDSEFLRAKMYWETPGIYVSIPLIYRFGTCRRWDIQFEPYYTSLTRHNRQEAFGANINVGANF